MSPQLFRINPDEKTPQQVREAEFAALGLRERHDIQEWIAKKPSILGDDLLVVTKEFSGFDRTDERLDLLAVDRLGNLVIIELKRDDTGADVHWQAIKYASYLSHATPDDIVGMLVDYDPEISSAAGAQEELLRHLDTGDLGSLNRSQRIIIASHRFAREVTSAVLWLNEQTGRNLITCIQLIPYQDAESNALYLQANTIIPIPGDEAYRIQMSSQGSFGLAAAAPRTSDTAKVNDAIRRAVDMADEQLPEEYVTAHAHRQGRVGWWHLWYSNKPWAERRVCYRVILRRKSKARSVLDEAALDQIHAEWIAGVYLLERGGLPKSLYGTLRERIGSIQTNNAQMQKYGNWSLLLGIDELSDDFVTDFADMIMRYIKVVTPEVNQAYERGEFGEDEDGEEEEEEE